MSDAPGTLIVRAGQREIRLLRKREMLDEIQGYGSQPKKDSEGGTASVSA